MRLTGREFKYLYSFLVLVLFLSFLTWCLLCYLVICFCFLLFSYVFGSGLVSSADGFGDNHQSISSIIDSSQPPPLTCIFLPTHKLPFFPSFS